MNYVLRQPNFVRVNPDLCLRASLLSVRVVWVGMISVSVAGLRIRNDAYGSFIVTQVSNLQQAGVSMNTAFRDAYG